MKRSLLHAGAILGIIVVALIIFRETVPLREAVCDEDRVATAVRKERISFADGRIRIEEASDCYFDFGSFGISYDYEISVTGCGAVVTWSESIPWLTITPESHTIPAGGSGTFTISCDRSGECPGDDVGTTTWTVAWQEPCSGEEYYTRDACMTKENTDPTAVASADITSGYASLEVHFDGSGSYDSEPADCQGIVSYAWVFGDGGTSDLVSPVHTYTSPGSYTAELTVTDANEGTGTDQVDIRVYNNPPVAVAVVTPDSGCVPHTITCDGSESYDPDGEIVSYEWDFGDGNTDQGAVVTHTYEEDGTFLVQLTVWDNHEDSNSTTISIIVVICAGIDITKCDPAWWPECGNVTPFTARIYWIVNGQCIYPGPPSIITFRLHATTLSKEKGICLNKGVGDAYDLHFNTPENYGAFDPVTIVSEQCDFINGCATNTVAAHDHWLAVRTKEEVTEATVYVLSEDYGSFGWIEAGSPGAAQLLPREPGGPVNCVFGPAVTKIPRDENGNDIPDTWWGDATNGTDPEWDDEVVPNQAANSQGDGLTRYEEFRGFYISGAHQRLLTLTKELLIYRENAAWGPEDVSFAADVHFIVPDEMNGARHDPGGNAPAGPGTVNSAKGPRIVNFNRTSHTKVDQHGLWRAVGGGDGRRGNWGLCRDNMGGEALPIGPPRSAGRVEIYENNIRAACTVDMSNPTFRYGAGRQRGAAWFFYNGTGRRDETIRDIIGHETGHGISLEHHPQQRVPIRHAPGSAADGWIDVNSRPWTGNSDEESVGGDRQCVMRYPFYEIWRSVALAWNPRGAFWRSGDDDWSPTLPVCNFGYCNVCRVTIRIDDAD